MKTLSLSRLSESNLFINKRGDMRIKGVGYIFVNC